MAENNISSIMGVTMEKIRSLVDSETIIGDPITVNDITVIPVSKVSFGFVSGGSDFPTKSEKTVFGGGGAAGATVTPVVFIVVKGNEVKLLQMSNIVSTIDAAVTAVPELAQKLTALFKKETTIE